MALPCEPMPEDTELAEALRDATAAFDKLTPDQQREIFRAQSKSWAIGEMMLEHPEMTRGEAEAIYERVKP